MTRRRWAGHYSVSVIQGIRTERLSETDNGAVGTPTAGHSQRWQVRVKRIIVCNTKQTASLERDEESTPEYATIEYGHHTISHP